MFHSATGDIWSGPEAMEDYAKLLHDINNDVLAVLVKLDNSRKDEFATWFKEGRAGWLKAAEAKELGLYDEVIGEDDTTVAGVSKETAAALAAHDLDIAAFAFDESNDDDPPETIALSEYQALEARLKGLQSAKDAEIATLKKSLKEEFETAKQDLTAQVSTLQADNEKLTQSLDAANTELSTLKTDNENLQTSLNSKVEQLKASEEARVKLTGNVLQAGDTFTSWEEAKKVLGYAQARRECSALYDEFMEANQK